MSKNNECFIDLSALCDTPASAQRYCEFFVASDEVDCEDRCRFNIALSCTCRKAIVNRLLSMAESVAFSPQFTKEG